MREHRAAMCQLNDIYTEQLQHLLFLVFEDIDLLTDEEIQTLIDKYADKAQELSGLENEELTV